MIRSLKIPKIRKSQKFWAIALISMIMAGGVSPMAIAALPATPSRLAQADTPVQLPQRPEPSASARLPRQVVRRLQRHASRQFDTHPREVQVISANQATWPNGCLGLAGPDEMCTMALVQGWRVEMTNGEQSWVYRTDERAQQIRLADTNTSELPPQVIDRLFATVAREANVPTRSLRLLEAQPKTWNGCMGIYEPNQACTEIAISGYRAIVMGDRQSWVYHLDHDGSCIVQNPTASGSLPAIEPSFIPANGQPPRPTEDVVFKMIVSGGLMGETTETILTEDGILYRTTTQMRTSTEPILLKQLSPQQVQQFQQLLEQQRFPNLDGMQYLTSAVLADYPKTTLQAMGSTVDYVDLEEDSLPQSLQSVIQAWNQL